MPIANSGIGFEASEARLPPIGALLGAYHGEVSYHITDKYR